MYQIADAGGNGTVPAFLSKLWSLVEDPNYDHLIRWDETGQSFHVYEQAQFAKEVLPLYFKHSNIASFIRQLNMYGFRKVMNVDQGGLKSDKDDLEFQHPYFMRGEEHLLEHIKRKVHKTTFDMLSAKPIVDSLKFNQSDISKVLTDITSLRGKQDNMNVKLENMKRENEALWREVANLRQKHAQQQQIVNKLIGFVVSQLVGGNRRAGLKRKMPLMLPDASQVANKTPKLSTIEDTLQSYSVQSPQSNTSAASPGAGPIIHDITDYLTPPEQLNEVKTIDSPKVSSAANINLNDYIHIPVTSELYKPSDSTNSRDSSKSRDFRKTSDSHKSSSPNLQSSNKSSNNYSKPFTDVNSEMSNHLDGMQLDINNLKEILASPSYNFDPNFLMGLFEGDAASSSNQNEVPNSSTSLFPSTSTLESADPPLGNELVQYIPVDDVPSLLDLADDDSVDLLPSRSLENNPPFVDLDFMLNTPLPLNDDEYKLLDNGVSADDLD